MKIRVWNNIEKCYEEVLDDPNHILCLNHGRPLFRLPLTISERTYGLKENRDDHPVATLSNVIGSPDFYTIFHVSDDSIDDGTVATIQLNYETPNS